MTSDKYHITKPSDGPYEFLSQHTIVVNGHFFPRPDSNKIIAALIQLTSDNAIDPTISLGRNIAHYLLLYPYYFYNDRAVINLLNILEKYICNKINFGTTYSVDAIRDCVDFDDAVVISTSHSLRAIAQNLYGFDHIGAIPVYELPSISLSKGDTATKTVSSALPVDAGSTIPQNSARAACTVTDIASESICTRLTERSVCVSTCCSAVPAVVEASGYSIHGCFVCDNNTPYMCVVCGMYLCHREGFSHLNFHSKSTNHKRVRATTYFKCTRCGISDPALVSIKNVCTNCDPAVQPIYSAGVFNLPYSSTGTIFHSVRISALLSKLFLHLAGHHYSNAIQCAMELVLDGLFLPYYRLVVYFAQLEHDSLRVREDVFVPLSVDNSDGFYYLKFKPAHKINMHGSYYVSDNKGSVAIVNPELYTHDAIGNENTIKFQCDITFVKFYHILNTIANIINSFPKRPGTIISRLLQISPPSEVEHGNDIDDIRLSIHNNYLTIVQGPPGTGKTYSCVKVLVSLYKLSSRPRVLICAASHRAVDVVHSAFIKAVGSARTRYFTP